MISFKNFITEASRAPLYHGTTYEALKYILSTDTLEATYGDEGNTGRDKAVSLSRSFNYAKAWARTKDRGDQYYAVLELDQNKLRQRYSIKPYNYFYNTGDFNNARNHPRKGKPLTDHGSTESEEYIDKDIKNITKYITKVTLINVTYPPARIAIRSMLPDNVELVYK